MLAMPIEITSFDDGEDKLLQYTNEGFQEETVCNIYLYIKTDIKLG